MSDIEHIISQQQKKIDTLTLSLEAERRCNESLRAHIRRLAWLNAEHSPAPEPQLERHQESLEEAPVERGKRG